MKHRIKEIDVDKFILERRFLFFFWRVVKVKVEKSVGSGRSSMSYFESEPIVFTTLTTARRFAYYKEGVYHDVRY